MRLPFSSFVSLPHLLFLLLACISVSTCAQLTVGLQGLTTREVGLGAIDTEGGGRLRAYRVSETCLVPVRKGEGWREKRKRPRSA
jgi:hypothetical protein